MDCTTIPLTALPHTSRLFRDYVGGSADADSIFPHHYRNPSAFRNAAKQINYPEDLRRAVVQLLTDQNRRWGSSEAREQNLARLAKPSCLAVVTGQQVGLFTGPAFTIYKALTAVKLTEQLLLEGIDAVPIFWLATEDHDLAEVNHTWVLDREGNPQSITYNGRPKVQDSPAGTLPLASDIKECIETLRQFLPESSQSQHVIEWLNAAYHPGENLGGAFGCAIAQMLSPFGVLTVDPLDPRVHRLTSKVFRNVAQQAGEIRQSLLDRNEHLISSGYHTQVRVHETSTLLFAYEGGRRSILHSEGSNFISGSETRYTAESLEGLAETTPELLSPTALLRPIMQDALFPTVSYVAGPAELAYLAQAVPVYQQLLRRMPVIVPRASITVIESPIQRLLGKYQLSIEDIFSGRQHLREKMAARFFSADLTSRFASATSSVEQHLAAIQEALQKLDPTLADAARNGAQKMLYQLSSLERKAAASIQSKSDQVERDATRLENTIYPEKGMQERLYCGASLLARYGMQLVDELHKILPATPTEHQILVME
jgi:bacillithiol biosynthesis cysteine-adding enzyme BshC